MSLLSKAKSFTPKRNAKSTPTKEEIELAVAWATGEVSSSQAAYALGTKSPAFKLLNSLKEYIRNEK